MRAAIGYAQPDPKPMPDRLSSCSGAIGVLHDTFGIAQSHGKTMTAAALAVLDVD